MPQNDLLHKPSHAQFGFSSIRNSRVAGAAANQGPVELVVRER
jgi:hypothetical protein